MVKCLCYHCKNRAVGCHKFCDNYRAYRRELEAMQEQKKKGEKEYRATITTFMKQNNEGGRKK